MIMNYGYEHVIIIYIERVTAYLESKYKTVCVVCLHTKEMRWDILKSKTQNFEIFFLVNKMKFVFYITIYHPDKNNSCLGI